MKKDQNANTQEWKVLSKRDSAVGFSNGDTTISYFHVVVVVLLLPLLYDTVYAVVAECIFNAFVFPKKKNRQGVRSRFMKIVGMKLFCFLADVYTKGVRFHSPKIVQNGTVMCNQYT